MNYFKHYLKMTQNSKELLKIYEEAKKHRIVLKQEEFAKLLDFRSRMHLFGRIIKSEEGVSDELLLKAKKKIGDALNNVSKNTINVTRDLPELVGERIELTAAMRAAIKILTLKCIEQEVKISDLESKLLKDKTVKQSFSDVSLELEKMMQDETEHILDEWRKK